MTPEQAQQVIAFLRGLDYTRQEDRNAASQMLDSLRQYPQLPREVADAVGQANAQLQQPGGVTATGPTSPQYASRFLGFKHPAQYIDELGVLIGSFNDMDTA